MVQIFDLSSHIDYSSDSVVSKTVLDKGKAGNITLFSFDEGQGLSEHTSPYDAVVSVTDGEAEITIENEIYKVNTGEMIIMPAGKPHALKAVKRFKMLLIMIKESK